MMKYKECVKNAKGIWCNECNKEYKPSVFWAHLRVKCKEEKENWTGETLASRDIEVHDIKFENTLEVDFILKDYGNVSHSFEDVIKFIASFINPDFEKYNQEITEMLCLS